MNMTPEERKRFFMTGERPTREPGPMTNYVESPMVDVTDAPLPDRFR